jgi:hypothetical protein
MFLINEYRYYICKKYKDIIIINHIIMIFRTSNGKLIEIKKSNYLNDSLYYKKIISIKK